MDNVYETSLRIMRDVVDLDAGAHAGGLPGISTVQYDSAFYSMLSG